MSQGTSQARLALKTPEGAFLQVLQTDFNFSRQVAGELLQTAQAMLVGTGTAQTVRPGQIRLLVASLKAPFGPPLAETTQVAVMVTLDAGAEDAVMKAREGVAGLRQGGILRLLDEALAQGGVLSQVNPYASITKRTFESTPFGTEVELNLETDFDNLRRILYLLGTFPTT